MSANLPITWLDKKNSPELEAFLKQYGDQYCMKAEEINQLRDAVNEMAVVQQSTFLGAAEPNFTPAGTGRAYWIAIKTGTYTNHGGFVIAANEIAFIIRDAAGAFSISKTGLDLSGYQKITDGDKINTWTAKAYLSGDQINYLGKDWVANAATVAGDVPATSSKWVERLSGYLNNESYKKLVPKISNKATNGDFADNLSGEWFLNGTGSTVSASAGILTANIPTYGSFNQRIPIISGNKYYISTKYKTTSDKIVSYSPDLNLSLLPIVPDNNYNLLSYIATATTTTSVGRFGFYKNGYTAPDSAATLRTVELDNFVVINLTEAFGVGSEPSLAAMDKIFSFFGNNYVSANQDVYNASMLAYFSEAAIKTNDKQPIINLDLELPLVGSSYTETTARTAVPVSKRQLGLIISYKTAIYENDTLIITGNATASGDFNVVLNGVTFPRTVTNGDTATQIATYLRAQSYAGWTAGGTGTTITFTSNTIGIKTLPSITTRVAAEKYELGFSVTTATAGNITITLNGVNFLVPIAAGDNLATVHTKLTAFNYTGWNRFGLFSGRMLFTNQVTGALGSILVFDGGTTGVSQTLLTTTKGSTNPNITNSFIVSQKGTDDYMVFDSFKGSILSTWETAANWQKIISKNELDKLILAQTGGFKILNPDGVTVASYDAIGFDTPVLSPSFIAKVNAGAGTQTLSPLGVAVSPIGDGVADDTAAIQAVINGVTSQGIVQLASNKKYRITAPLNINTRYVKLFTSNNCPIIVDGNFEALNIYGSMINETADPGTLGNQIKNEESYTIVTNTRITNLIFGFGTGIKVSGTFGLTIDKCAIYGMNNGISVRNKNRNTNILNNSIFNNKRYALDFESTVNLHQININNNQILGCERGISFDNSTMYNVQISGNDLEAISLSGVTDSLTYVIYAVMTTGVLQEVSISANTIQAHNLQNVMKFESSLRSGNNQGISLVQIAGNQISNSLTSALFLKNVRNFSITGNTVANCTDTFASIESYCDGVVINSNSFSTSGIFKCLSNASISSLLVVGNSVLDSGKNVISLSPTSGKDIIIKDNTIHTSTDLSSGSAIIMTLTNLDGLKFKENIIRCSSASVALSVTGTGSNIDNNNNMLITY